jgi:predicted RNA-binding Zn ribbon-like protein
MTQTTRPELFSAFANSGWTTGSDLSEWLMTRGLLDANARIDQSDDEVARFDRLRALIRDVADQLGGGHDVTRGQVGELNRLLRRGPHVHALSTDGPAPALVAIGVGSPFEQARADIAESLALYLAEGDPRRLRRCASDTCRWVFVDRSRSGRRRWCDMSVCGNRAKVRRHRARRRDDGPDQDSQFG